MQLTIQDRNELQQLRAELPPQQLFASAEEGHALMMETVRECLAESQKGSFFPDEATFCASVKALWLEYVLAYCPRA